MNYSIAEDKGQNPHCRIGVYIASLTNFIDIFRSHFITTPKFIYLHNKINDTLNHSHKMLCYFQTVFIIDYFT